VIKCFKLSYLKFFIHQSCFVTIIFSTVDIVKNYEEIIIILNYLINLRKDSFEYFIFANQKI